MFFFKCEKVDLTPEINFFEMYSLCWEHCTWNQGWDWQMCVCVCTAWKQSVCAFTYVCAAGDSKVTSSLIGRCVSLDDVFGGHLWNMEKQGIIRSPQNSKNLGEVPSSQGVNSW